MVFIDRSVKAEAYCKQLVQYCQDMQQLPADHTDGRVAACVEAMTGSDYYCEFFRAQSGEWVRLTRDLGSIAINFDPNYDASPPWGEAIKFDSKKCDRFNPPPPPAPATEQEPESVHEAGGAIAAVSAYAAVKSGLAGKFMQFARKTPAGRVLAPAAIVVAVGARIYDGDSFGDCVGELFTGIVCTILGGCSEAL